MAWDATAKKVAVKAIGQVESSLNYAAINYNDPITVGMAQWYGTRAAAILNRMRAAHSAEYARVDAGLRSRLETVSEGSSSWNTYYLSRQAGDSLRDLLLASKDIQGDQIVKDLESYFTVAKQYGINPETRYRPLITTLVVDLMRCTTQLCLMVFWDSTIIATVVLKTLSPTRTPAE